METGLTTVSFRDLCALEFSKFLYKENESSGTLAGGHWIREAFDIAEAIDKERQRRCDAKKGSEQQKSAQNGIAAHSSTSD